MATTIAIFVSVRRLPSPTFLQSQLYTMRKRRPSPAAPAGLEPMSGVGSATPVAAEPAPAGADAMSALMATLDADAVGRLRELDPTGASGLLLRVLRAFDGSLQRLLQQLQDARGTVDFASIRHVAHTLKSSSASIGALHLSKLCADIESRVREGQTDGLDPLLDGMVSESTRLIAVLKPVLDA
jgi:HPt (histidine-containing phosphotransfer) domain-containing protein